MEFEEDLEPDYEAQEAQEEDKNQYELGNYQEENLMDNDENMMVDDFDEVPNEP